MKKDWTVVGYYEDNKQPWADCYVTETWEQAQAAAHEDHPEGGEDDHYGPIIVVGVIEGEHAVFGGDNEHGI